MPINYGLDRNIVESADRHVDRVKRLVQLAGTDAKAVAAVCQSLEYLEKKDSDKFQKLMQDSAIEGISREHNHKESHSPQENATLPLTQGKLPLQESQQQRTGGAEENNPPAPKTHLVLTVGTNALPVWVAWYHLSKKLGPVSTQFVHTAGTNTQRELLEGYITRAGASPLPHIHTSESSPNIDKIHRKIIDALPNTCRNLHVHYTGGTQAMGVATVSAMQKVENTLKSCGRTINTDASYLDPGRSGPPKIVSWSDKNLKKDTRENIVPKMDCKLCITQAETQIRDFNCNACLRKVADLNNFEVAYFESNHPPKKCPSPGKPSPAEIAAAQKMFEKIDCFDYSHGGSQRNYIRDNLIRKWDGEVRGGNRYFEYPRTGGKFTFAINDQVKSGIWQNEILPALNCAYSEYSWDTTTGALCYPSKANASDHQRRDLKGIDEFLHGFWLEYVAYDAFKEELKQTNRNNYEIFNNVYVRPKGSSLADKHFELDVVAVLGYQVIVVSCGLTTRQREIKLKAMEAYHRAKQLGGDEARAVVLCVANNHVVQGIQKELEDETGTKDPLQVWGKCNMTELRQKFNQLLLKLHWI